MLKKRQMARLTDNDRKLILADYHTGHYSVRELAQKHSVGKTTVAKMVKDIEPKNKDKVDTLVSVHTELAEQSGQEVDSVSRLVDEKTKHLKLINDNSTKLANKLAMMADQIEDAQDLKSLVDANDKLSLTLKVNERHAPRQVTAVQVNTDEKKDPVTGMKGLYGVLHE